MKKKVPFTKELETQVKKPQLSRMSYIYDLGIKNYDIKTLDRLNINVSLMKDSKFRDELMDNILQRRLNIARQDFRKGSEGVIENVQTEKEEYNQLPSLATVRIRMRNLGYGDDPKQKKNLYQTITSKCKRDFINFFHGLKQKENTLGKMQEESERLNKISLD